MREQTTEREEMWRGTGWRCYVRKFGSYDVCF